MITEYQQRLRDRYLAAPVMSAPAPWQPVLDRRTPIGGLLGIGFAVHPDTGHDLAMVVSHDGGHGLFDAVTGEKIARDRDPDPATSIPDAHPDLTCPGLGPVAGTLVRIAASSAAVCTAPPRTVGRWTSSAPNGPMTASSSPPTAEHTKDRLEAPGGMSSTPNTRSCALPVFPRPVSPWQSPPAATSPSGPARNSISRTERTPGWRLAHIAIQPSPPRSGSTSTTNLDVKGHRPEPGEPPLK